MSGEAKWETFGDAEGETFGYDKKETFREPKWEAFGDTSSKTTSSDPFILIVDEVVGIVLAAAELSCSPILQAFIDNQLFLLTRNSFMK